MMLLWLTLSGGDEVYDWVLWVWILGGGDRGFCEGDEERNQM
ncbi:hypothetical protein RchiOBHm_Chr7g0226901 [Rosa chinensis]|uniref:Uncharacterized protein n=1 Tax=Rosa chinensis TaxID=74649 RepID=A0A2P6PEG6_ROSCH|nr:hypothetical protein RchiOBHm_Chr7g0226901 [Rosa chinensis]